MKSGAMWCNTKGRKGDGLSAGKRKKRRFKGEPLLDRLLTKALVAGKGSVGNNNNKKKKDAALNSDRAGERSLWQKKYKCTGHELCKTSRRHCPISNTGSQGVEGNRETEGSR